MSKSASCWRASRGASIETLEQRWTQQRRHCPVSNDAFTDAAWSTKDGRRRDESGE